MPAEALVAELIALLRSGVEVDEAWRRSVFDCLQRLESMCGAGIVTGSQLDVLYSVQREGQWPDGTFTALLVRVQLASCYLLSLAPDRADRIVVDCREQLAGADLDQPRRELIAAALDQLSVLLGYDEDSSGTSIEYSVLAPGPVREAFLAGLAPSDAARMAREASRRDLARLTSLIDACDPNTPGSVAALRAELAEADRPAELVAYGWFVLAASLGRPEERAERQTAVERAYHFIAPVQSSQISVLGKLQLLSAYHHLECGDLEKARAEYEDAVTSFFALRNAAADPTLRPRFADQGDWADDVVRMGYDLQMGERLFGVIAGLQAHGLVEALHTSESEASVRGRWSRASIRDRLSSTWQPSWYWPRQIVGALPDDTALLQVFRGYDDEGFIVSQLLTSDSLTTKKANVSARLIGRVFPVSAKSVVRLRRRDWLALSAFVLPDEILEGRLAVRRLVVAPGEGMATIPFASLVTDVGVLSDRFEIVTLPHLRLWGQRTTNPTRLQKVCVVGCDTNERPDVGVAGLDAELQALEALGVAVRRVSSFGDLARWLPETDALILGIHGQVDAGENVLLFPDGQEILAVELASLPLPELVIAAACWSGGLQATPSPFTLVPSCLLGGARDLVVALWDADSHVLSDTLIELYAALVTGAPLPAALRTAQTAVGGVSPLAAVSA